MKLSVHLSYHTTGYQLMIASVHTKQITVNNNIPTLLSIQSTYSSVRERGEVRNKYVLEHVMVRHKEPRPFAHVEPLVE